MRQFISRSLVATALGFAFAGATPASAQLSRPYSLSGILAATSSTTSDVINAEYRGRRYDRPRRYYQRRYNRNRWRGVAPGIGFGAIFGGPYYGRSSSEVAYCTRRFRSYDPRSGTYLGYDGYRHRCP